MSAIIDLRIARTKRRRRKLHKAYVMQLEINLTHSAIKRSGRLLRVKLRGYLNLLILRTERRRFEHGNQSLGMFALVSLLRKTNGAVSRKNNDKQAERIKALVVSRWKRILAKQSVNFVLVRSDWPSNTAFAVVLLKLVFVVLIDVDFPKSCTRRILHLPLVGL